MQYLSFLLLLAAGAMMAEVRGASPGSCWCLLLCPVLYGIRYSNLVTTVSIEPLFRVYNIRTVTESRVRMRDARHPVDRSTNSTRLEDKPEEMPFHCKTTSTLVPANRLFTTPADVQQRELSSTKTLPTHSERDKGSSVVSEDVAQAQRKNQVDAPGEGIKMLAASSFRRIQS